MPDEQVHKEINEAIDASLKESPDSANQIAEKTGQHVTLVARIMAKRFEWRGGRWVWRHNKPKENE